ncbi:MAG: ATP-dependent Clp protease ATP-binding subunit [Proteobacteria bacterium]|nr:ATP-dependent Clp protease ATP-binding subunit [Pseudomonadota bacterium]
MITRELEKNINTVRTDARRRGLEHLTIEHLALVLLNENTAVQEMLLDSSADTHGLKNKLKQFITSKVPPAKSYGDEPQPTAGFKRTLQRAVSDNQSSQSINGLHILVAIFSEPECYASYYMQKYGIERLALLARLAQQNEQTATDNSKKSNAADTDLVAQANSGQLEKPSGRLEEINMLMRVLSCKYKNNALLVGDPGVGKTAIVHAFAHHVAAGEVPANMRGMRVVPVNIAELVAGTKYRGDFEQRVQQLVEKCRAHGNTVIFIDEIHTIIGAGAVSGGVLDGANILKPMLEEKNVRYIGATTQAEYRRFFEKDRALTRRFTKINIEEPDEETLQTILQDTVKRLKQHHGVDYANNTINSAIESSRRYISNRCLPDKAIALLDEAGARRQIQMSDARDNTPISKEEIEQLARKTSGLPPLYQEEKAQLATLEEKLTTAVLEQEEAAKRLARAVLCSQLDYQEAQTVIGAFLFYGPTGVGKTEMARQLAQHLKIPLLRYDMSEYMERHAVSRLIGAPPGYVGYEQSGKLVEDVSQHPNSVILFDEIEKAHPDVLNILLQILDYGTLTDNNGRNTNFNGTLIILTSNLGSSEMERSIAGFEREANYHSDDAVRHFFTPEMRNRIDALIRFQPLSAETIAHITDLQLDHALRQIASNKKIRVKLSNKLRTQLKKESYSPDMGARPLKRLIKQKVLEPLALAEANGIIYNGGSYCLDETGITTLQKQRTRTKKKVPVTA